MRKLLVVLLIVGACSSGDDDGPRLADPDETTEAQGEFGVGDRVETAVGNFYTLHAYEQPVAHDEFSAPDEGTEYAAIDIEFCAVTDSYPVGQRDYELQMEDNTRRGRTIPIKEPALPNTSDVAKGGCLRGWVTYEVPVGERPEFVVMLQTDPVVKFAL